jgi:predicted branched-subunit amino acid permease
MSAPAATSSASSSTSAFLYGLWSGVTSVFILVLSGTYVGLGALAHDFHFSEWWLALSTVLVWAGPAQLILITALGTGGAPIEAAIAISLSGIRLFPLVVTLLPLLREKGTPLRKMVLPTHFTSVSMWVENMRLLPALPMERRVAFCNGLSSAYMAAACICGFAGFYLAAGLPALLAAGLLFLTPMAFLISTARNATQMIDRIALALGLALGPAITAAHIGLDLMWTGVIGGTLANGFHRLRKAVA